MAINPIIYANQSFTLRFGKGRAALLDFRLNGPNRIRFNGPSTPAERDLINRQFGYEDTPDPGSTFAYGVLQALGGGTVDDNRNPDVIEKIQRAWELPAGAIA